MSQATVRCANGKTHTGRICDNYGSGLVEVEDDDGNRWTGRRVLDEGLVVAASHHTHKT